MLYIVSFKLYYNTKLFSRHDAMIMDTNYCSIIKTKLGK